MPSGSKQRVGNAVRRIEDADPTHDLAPERAPGYVAAVVLRGYDEPHERARVDAYARRLKAGTAADDPDEGLGHGYLVVSGRTLVSAALGGPEVVREYERRDVRVLPHDSTDDYILAILVPEARLNALDAAMAAGEDDPEGSTAEDDPGTAA